MKNLAQKQDVLIIDDEMDICYLLGGLLKQKEMNISCAYNLHDATEMLNHNDPKIIFLDNHLPDGLGINYISQIKKEHPHSKVVLLTAHDSTINRRKAMSEGADFFVGKPFTKEMVFGIVDTLLTA